MDTQKIINEHYDTLLKFTALINRTVDNIKRQQKQIVDLSEQMHAIKVRLDTLIIEKEADS